MKRGPISPLWEEGRTADPSPGAGAALGFRAGSCGRVSMVATATGLDLFPGKNISGGEETEKPKPEESMCMYGQVERGWWVRKWLMLIKHYGYSSVATKP